MMMASNPPLLFLLHSSARRKCVSSWWVSMPPVKPPFYTNSSLVKVSSKGRGSLSDGAMQNRPCSLLTLSLPSSLLSTAVVTTIPTIGTFSIRLKYYFLLNDCLLFRPFGTTATHLSLSPAFRIQRRNRRVQEHFVHSLGCGWSR